MEGEWAWPEEAGEAKPPLGSNTILDHLVLRLHNIVNEPRPATPPPVFHQFTLKACVLGQPCSGKSTCLAKLAQGTSIHPSIYLPACVRACVRACVCVFVCICRKQCTVSMVMRYVNMCVCVCVHRAWYPYPITWHPDPRGPGCSPEWREGLSV